MRHCHGKKHSMHKMCYCSKLRNQTWISMKELKPGDAGIIIGYEKGECKYRKKLLAMGLTTGTTFRVIRQAPLGDPIEIFLRGYNLSLRSEEAHILRIVKSY